MFRYPHIAALTISQVAWVLSGLFVTLLLGNIGSEKPDLPINLHTAKLIKVWESESAAPNCSLVSRDYMHFLEEDV
jgi:hypothetical protein